MLIICYGMQKSASSFCFQLVVDILEAAGHSQEKFQKEILAKIPDTTSNGLIGTNWECLGQVIQKIPANKIYAVKTHGSFTPRINALMELDMVKAFATHRDLYDASLSLSEHAARQRDAKHSGDMGFARVENLSDAIAHIGRQIPRVESWVSHPKVRPFSYDILKNNPQRVCEIICNRLQIKADISKILEPYENKKNIQNYNVGKAGRFTEVATEDEKRLSEFAFADFSYDDLYENRKRLASGGAT